MKSGYSTAQGPAVMRFKPRIEEMGGEEDVRAEEAGTPFFSRLRQYVARDLDAWHTPGHSGGESFRNSASAAGFARFMSKSLFESDLSVSVDELDSLLEPCGVIAEAQRLAAQTFGARRSYFVTNGSSTSNKIILQALIQPGDKLLLDRNSHMSAHQGMFLAGARPVYLNSSSNGKYGLFGPIPKRAIFAALDTHPDARALFLTSCTYDGLRYDLAPIIEHAHARGIKVVVDEAWYAHARFHPELRPTGLECGADYVTHSIHKMLSAFSQASLIHVNDPDFDERRFLSSYSLHTSSSPSYPIIASIDMARHQMDVEGASLLARTLDDAQAFRRAVRRIDGLRPLGLQDLLSPEVAMDGVRLDPTKVTIDTSGTGHPAESIKAALLKNHGIQVEKCTANTLTVLFTVGTTRAKAARLLWALRAVAASAKMERAREPAAARAPRVPDIGAFHCLPRDAHFQRGEALPLFDAREALNLGLVGRVAAEMVIPKPPGIPVLIPGQVIDEAVLSYLAQLLRSQPGLKVLGLRTATGGGKGVVVLTAEEMASVPRSDRLSVIRATRPSTR